MNRRHVLLGSAAVATTGAVLALTSMPAPVEPEAPTPAPPEVKPPVDVGVQKQRALDAELSDAERWVAFQAYALHRVQPIPVSSLAAAFVKAHLDLKRGPPRDAPALDWLTAKMLLSSDFFLTGMDEAREPRFLTYHDPYRNPCWNPFPPA